jgi:hypothetical protein
MSAHLKALKTCAFCPNPCRSALPIDEASAKESSLPSTQSLMALYLSNDTVPDEAVRTALEDRSVVRVCQERCVYGFDIDSAIAQVLDGRATGPATERAAS